MLKMSLESRTSSRWFKIITKSSAIPDEKHACAFQKNNNRENKDNTSNILTWQKKQDGDTSDTYQSYDSDIAGILLKNASWAPATVPE